MSIFFGRLCAHQEREPGVISQDSTEPADPEPVRNEVMPNATDPVPLKQLPNVPPCPRCSGIPHEPDDAWLCDRCVDQLEAIDREDAAEDRARELAEDREYWGTR